MPSYDFQIVDKETDTVLHTVALNLPIGKRDGVELRRVTVPQRVIVVGSAPDNPSDLHKVDMKNLYASEQRLGSRFEQFHGRSKKEMRKIWSKENATA